MNWFTVDIGLHEALLYFVFFYPLTMAYLWMGGGLVPSRKSRLWPHQTNTNDDETVHVHEHWTNEFLKTEWQHR